MELIVFEKDSYYQLMEETLVLMYKVIHEKHKETISIEQDENDFISTTEAMKLLRIKSRNRLYDLRDQKAIVFYQHGRRILYSKKSIITYLKGQKIE